MNTNPPPLLTHREAKKLLQGETRITLDLGISEATVENTDGGVILPDGSSITVEKLKQIEEKEDAVMFLMDGQVYQAAIRARSYYKLYPTAGAPTIEIDGIRMHRTKDTTPDQDSRDKLKLLGFRSGLVLDTCMGLGYTAIGAARKGAEHVITVELDPNVHHIAMLNPWSKALYSDPSIHKVIGDSFHVIDSLPDGLFTAVLHDPPRHGHAGHLYGSEFYRKLFRVIAPGGELFHYTGEPRSKYRGANLPRGVMKRLRDTGFRDISYHSKVMGVTCVKPEKS